MAERGRAWRSAAAVERGGLNRGGAHGESGDDGETTGAACPLISEANLTAGERHLLFASGKNLPLPNSYFCSPVVSAYRWRTGTAILFFILLLFCILFFILLSKLFSFSLNFFSVFLFCSLTSKVAHAHARATPWSSIIKTLISWRTNI